MWVNKWKKPLILGGFCLGILLLARHLFPIFFPFLLGAGLAFGSEPVVGLLTTKYRFPRWAGAGIGVTLFFILTAGILILLISVLARQLGRLSGLLPQLADAVSAGLFSLKNWLLQISGRLPGNMANFLRDSVENMFSDSSSMLQQAVSQVPQVATGLMGTLGQWIFVLFTAILSGYMISSRLPKIKQWCRSKLPQTWYAQYLPAFRGLRRAAGGWLVAQGKLMGLTFLLLIAGFFLLHIQNVLVVAILITLVDAFPILGTGTILVPWSLICLLQGDHGRGIGLLGLYVVVWLARSVLEPRILGKELGLDPLITLFSVYAGFCIMGIGGMLIAPIVAMLVTQLLKHQTQ